jgi:molybdate transport system substrate-binding protein
MKALAIVAITFTLLQPAGAGAAEIRVLASTGVSTVMKQLIPVFERSSGIKVNVTYDTSNTVLGQIKGGETADLIILTAPVIDELTGQGKIAPGGRTDFARTGVGVAVRTGAPKPDISSVDAFRRALLNAKSVTYTTTGASGIYFAGVIEKLGIAAEVKAKAKTPAGGHVADLVANGEAELGVQLTSEVRGVPGADYLGPLPAQLQMYTVFSAGLFAGAKDAEAAKALIRFLTSPEAARAFQAGGFEPG